jgi:hypothetical protein
MESDPLETRIREALGHLYWDKWAQSNKPERFFQYLAPRLTRALEAVLNVPYDQSDYRDMVDAFITTLQEDLKP